MSEDVRQNIDFPMIPKTVDEEMKTFLMVLIDTIKDLAQGTSYVEGDLVIGGNIRFQEAGANPVDPQPGETVIWRSDGTGDGDDGDIMMSSNVDGNIRHGVIQW